MMYLTQWFTPEPNIVKGPSFVRALEAAGHQVTVVTGLPNYPEGKLYPGYRLRAIQREMIDGVQVVRLPLYPSHDRSSLRRSLNFLSFFVSAFLYCLLRRTRYDLAYVYQPPITVGLAVALAGRLRRLPLVLDVQDLWPDTIAATGMPGADRLVPLLRPICDFVYRRAAAIVVQSTGIRRALIERGVPAAKITTIHNWADVSVRPSAEPPAADSSAARFTIVYGGNFGRAQALDRVIDAAGIIRGDRSDIEIVLYGSGVEEDRLRRQALELGESAVGIRGRLPQDAIVKAFTQADALLIHLADDPLFEITIPSKTQFYLAMGRPIIAGVGGEAARLLEQSGAAIVVPPCDPRALAEAICTMADLPIEQRRAMAANGERFYAERLSLQSAIAQTVEVLRGARHAGRRDALAVTS
ncbi:MAG TPA: glycosyltransferase family 4 protein [Sphingomicrobium sp.]|nr:glycosyltransferase family 4 protein [Sphingomicrobium sp.]